MKKILISLIFLILLSGMVLAQTEDNQYSWKEVPQGNCFTWKQGYSNSTYTNFTSITYPNKTQIIFNPSISGLFNNGEYQYLDCNYTQLLGEYQVCSHTDVDGIDTLVCNNYLVTPNGQAMNDSNIALYILIILMLYGITFVGFFGKNIPITVLGGMSMLGLGLYTINNGIIIYRDFITTYFSYVTLAIGAILSLWAIVEWIQDIM